MWLPKYNLSSIIKNALDTEKRNIKNTYLDEVSLLPLLSHKQPGKPEQYKDRIQSMKTNFNLVYIQIQLWIQ